MKKNEIRLFDYNNHWDIDPNIINEVCEAALNIDYGTIDEMIDDVSVEAIEKYHNRRFSNNFTNMIDTFDSDFMERFDITNLGLFERIDYTLEFSVRSILQANRDILIKNFTILYINATYISRVDSLSSESFKALLEDVLLRNLEDIDDIMSYTDDFFKH